MWILKFIILLSVYSATGLVGESRERGRQRPLTFDRMNVSGQVVEKEGPLDDKEDQMLDQALKENQRTAVGFEKKSKKYHKLTGVVEEMKEKHSDYLDHKSGYENVVSRMNEQLECAQNREKKGCDVVLGVRGRGTTPNLGQDVYDLFKNQQKDFDHCYHAFLREVELQGQSNPTPFNGEMVLEFELGGDGLARKIQIFSEVTTLQHSSGLTQCVGSVLEKMNFSFMNHQSVIKIRQPLSFILHKDF